MFYFNIEQIKTIRMNSLNYILVQQQSFRQMMKLRQQFY